MQRLSVSRPWLHVFTEKNSKQSAARNLGLSHVKGDCVAFIDSDDELDDSFIEKMVSPMVNDSKKWTICGIRKAWESGKVDLEEHSIFERVMELDQLRVVGQYLNQNQEMDAGLWNKVFSMQIIKDNQIHFENKNFYEDMLFNLKYYLCLRNTDIVTISDVLYTLNRVKGSSTTTTYDPEMDRLTRNFYKLVLDVLSNNFNSDVRVARILDTLKVRLTIHSIHYHCVTDSRWSLRQTKQLVKKNIQFRKIPLQYELTLKYKFACFALIVAPRLYMLLYLNNWG